MLTTVRRWAALDLVLAAVIGSSLSLITAAPVDAADGEPIAIRAWPDQTWSIETHSGLKLVISADSKQASQRDTLARADRVIGYQPLDHTLSRRFNQKEIRWQAFSAGNEDAANSLRVTSVGGSGRVAGQLVRCDGVAMLFLAVAGSPSVKSWKQLEDSDIDVLAIPGSSLADDSMVALCKRVKPRRIVVVADQAASSEFGRKVSVETVRVQRHNTTAVSASLSDGSPQIVALSTSPWEMPASLKPLFKAMESSNESSQAVFAKLTAEQLNFRPSNGTHTPRWNAEHMMGRQLLFFSQIYHAQDESIPVMDLNPKQMPPDYRAAHPDWDGREEARLLQRVSEFTRRFAYLLEGVDLDRRAPGSRWTLSALLRQMDRHYGQHTGNTVKKFDLPEFPSE